MFPADIYCYEQFGSVVIKVGHYYLQVCKTGGNQCCLNIFCGPHTHVAPAPTGTPGESPFQFPRTVALMLLQALHRKLMPLRLLISHDMPCLTNGSKMRASLRTLNVFAK